jgi:hypothetical protein
MSLWGTYKYNLVSKSLLHSSGAHGVNEDGVIFSVEFDAWTGSYSLGS